MEKARRYSPKREAILECLRSTHNHPAAEWGYAQLKPSIPDLSLATVYRNLGQFRKDGTIQVIGNVDGEERYDGDTSPHSHFICRSCGKVYTLTPYGHLEATDGDAAFTHVPDWYKWEREQVRKELEDGTELFYTSLVNKVVAEDYVITDEEKALQEAGKLNIAYDGRKGPEVDTSISSHVTWVQNGVTYSMMVMDGGLSAEEMFGMAQEIVESE